MGATITMNIEERDLTDLVKNSLNKRGLATTPDFLVSFNLTKGDRPYDVDTISLIASGIKV